MLETNGSATSRSLYTDVTTIGLLARAPTQASGAPIGLVVFTVDYEFSGQRSPAVSVLPDQIPAKEEVKEDRHDPQEPK
jgi:hypothetical protein